MKSKLILVLITISLIIFGVQATCRNGCATCNGNKCLSCSAENAIVDPHERACICKENYYATSLNPLTCEAKISGSEQDPCEQEIGLNIVNFEVNTKCYYQTDNQLNFVISEVSIDTDHSHFNSQNCRSSIRTSIQYCPKGFDGEDKDKNYFPLPTPSPPKDPYLSSLPGGKNGDFKIKIPLIDVFDLAHVSDISQDGSQIVQEIWFRIQIGHSRKVLRSHRWCMYIYTNRNQVQIFNIDVDIKKTDSCQPGQECIVLADLDVDGKQYKSDWVTERDGKGYVVGDWMYMRIWFKDSTYLKQLSFQKLYYKNDENKVFDFTNLTDNAETKWNHDDNSLHVKLKLIEPSENALVQVNMLIEEANARLRRLSSADNSTKQQFKMTILSPTPTVSNAKQTNNDQQKANSSSLFFGMFTLLFMIINLY